MLAAPFQSYVRSISGFAEPSPDLGMSDFIDRGTGPVLVLLHGAGVDNRLWDPQISSFETTHRVIAPNLPGHGGVAAVDSVEQMADWIERQLAERGVRRYSVVGLSLGGMVALELASRRPDDVTHLVMIESVPRVSDHPVVRLFARVMINLLRLVPPKFLVTLPGRQMGAETAGAADYIKSAIARMTSSNIHSVMRAALAYDGRPHLAHLPMPVTVMIGEKNKATHDWAAEMTKAIKHSKLIVIPKAGHIANRDAADFTNDALRSVLGEK